MSTARDNTDCHTDSICLLAPGEDSAALRSEMRCPSLAKLKGERKAAPVPLCFTSAPPTISTRPKEDIKVQIPRIPPRLFVEFTEDFITPIEVGSPLVDFKVPFAWPLAGSVPKTIEEPPTPIEVDTPPASPTPIAPHKNSLWLTPSSCSTPSPTSFSIASSTLSDNVSQTLTPATTTPGSPQNEKLATALSDTMSNQNECGMAETPHSASQNALLENSTVACHWLLLLKDIFAYRSIGEIQFEHIEDGLWIDEVD